MNPIDLYQYGLSLGLVGLTWFAFYLAGWLGRAWIIGWIQLSASQPTRKTRQGFRSWFKTRVLARFRKRKKKVNNGVS